MKHPACRCYQAPHSPLNMRIKKLHLNIIIIIIIDPNQVFKCITPPLQPSYLHLLDIPPLNHQVLRIAPNPNPIFKTHCQAHDCLCHYHQCRRRLLVHPHSTPLLPLQSHPAHQSCTSHLPPRSYLPIIPIPLPHRSKSLRTTLLARPREVSITLLLSHITIPSKAKPVNSTQALSSR